MLPIQRSDFMANIQPTPASPPMPASPPSILAPFSFLQKEIDRVFKDFAQGVGFNPVSLDEADFDFRPAAELHENGTEATIRVELPGVDQKDVDVSVVDDTIEISGEKKSQTEAKDGDKYRSERTFGSFYRSFTLPYSIDAKKVDATFDKGVLTVKIGKPAGAVSKGTKIAIKN